MNYKVGDYLVHENSSVCQITEITDMELAGRGSMKTYYVMNPVFKQGAQVFTPVEGAFAKIRPVSSASEINELLDRLDKLEVIVENNERVRAEKLKGIMAQFTTDSLAMVVRTALLRKWLRIQEGKKVMASDEKILATAGRKLYEEMAFATSTTVEDCQSLFEQKVREHCEEGIAALM